MDSQDSGSGSGRAPRTVAKRPESMLAQNFAADLDAMFGLTPAIDGLENELNQKHANIQSGTTELRELEARLRAAEQRLANASSRNASPSRPPPPPPPAPRQEEQMRAGATTTLPSRTSPLAQRPTYPSDRPPTAHNRPPIPGTRRETEQMLSTLPGNFPSDMQQRNMSNDYIMVDNSASRGL